MIRSISLTTAILTTTLLATVHCTIGWAGRFTARNFTAADDVACSTATTRPPTVGLTNVDSKWGCDQIGGQHSN
ncbi:MAG: hypothetical protein MKZ95_06210 [Pirellulales bacterium]|nr:hypothetical protein [Pirellulales bacterium]